MAIPEKRGRTESRARITLRLSISTEGRLITRGRGRGRNKGILRCRADRNTKFGNRREDAPRRSRQTIGFQSVRVADIKRLLLLFLAGTRTLRGPRSSLVSAIVSRETRARDKSACRVTQRYARYTRLAGIRTEKKCVGGIVYSG